MYRSACGLGEETKTRHNNLVRSLREREHVLSCTTCIFLVSSQPSQFLISHATLNVAFKMERGRERVAGERERGREGEWEKTRGREREREGPRLRVTTVRKCAALTGSWLPNQAPAAPYPSRQAGGGPVALPPGKGTNKSGMRTRGGVPSSSLMVPAPRPNPASRGGDHPLPLWCLRLPRPQSG